jgi:hypothetical protein
MIDIGFRIIGLSQHVDILVAPLARVALVEFESKFAAARAVKAEEEGIVGTRHPMFPDFERYPYPSQLPTHEIPSRCTACGAPDALVCCVSVERTKG